MIGPQISMLSRDGINSKLTNWIKRLTMSCYSGMNRQNTDPETIQTTHLLMGKPHGFSSFRVRWKNMEPRHPGTWPCFPSPDSSLGGFCPERSDRTGIAGFSGAWPGKTQEVIDLVKQNGSLAPRREGGGRTLTSEWRSGTVLFSRTA